MHGPLSQQDIEGIVDRLFPDVHLVDCKYQPGDSIASHYALQLENLTELLLKVYAPGAPDQTPDQEVRLLRLLTSETGVPVPRVLLASEGVSAEESPRWILLSRLPGQPLAQVRDTLEPWDLESLGYEAGRYLAHIHQISVDTFGTLFADDPDNQVREKPFILAEVDQCLAECTEHGLLDGTIAQKLRNRLADSDLLTRRQPCLLHGDYQSTNLIVEQGMTGHHVTGIQDFAHAQGGSPEQDIATFFVHDLTDDNTAQKEFLDGYTESGELTASFWDRLALYQAFTGLCYLTRAGPECAPQKQRLYVDSILAYLNPR